MTDVEFFEKNILCAMRHANTPQRDFENLYAKRGHYEAALMALKMVGGINGRN